METFLIVVVIILVFLCIIQFCLFTQLCKLCIDIQPQSITDTINKCFDKLYDKQSKILVKRFWQKSVDGLIYINKDFFDYITYDIAPSQIKVIFSSYLSGMYDKEIEEALAYYVSSLYDFCRMHDNVSYRNIANKYKRGIVSRVNNISGLSIDFDKPIRTRIVNIFDTNGVPNQYIYSGIGDYDFCFKEDYEQLREYLINMKLFNRSDAFSFLKELGCIYHFLIGSRFCNDKESIAFFVNRVLEINNFSKCLECINLHILFYPLRFREFENKNSVRIDFCFKTPAEEDVYIIMLNQAKKNDIDITVEDIKNAYFNERDD